MSHTETLSTLVNTYLEERSRGRQVCRRATQSQRSVLTGLACHAGDIPPGELTAAHAVDFLASRRITSATWRSYDSTIRAWARWMVENGHLHRDPFATLRRPARQRTTPRGLPAGEVRRLLRHVDGDERSTLIVLLMVQQGLRCLEVAGLELGHVDTHERTMLVIGKGGHERVLPVTDETWAALVDYLAVRGWAAGPLIHNERRHGWGLSAGQVSRIVGRWMADAGVAGTAHALRHTCAGDVLRGGANLRDVQRLLGHASLDTTQHYLPLVVHDLRAAMAGRKYRGHAA